VTNAPAARQAADVAAATEGAFRGRTRLAQSGKGDRSPVCMTLTPSAWWLLVLAVPVLLAGEALLRRMPVLVRCNIPASVAGGLLAAALVLGLQATGLLQLVWQTKVNAAWWTWLATPEPEWLGSAGEGGEPAVARGFFTCVGLAICT